MSATTPLDEKSLSIRRQIIIYLTERHEAAGNLSLSGDFPLGAMLDKLQLSRTEVIYHLFLLHAEGVVQVRLFPNQEELGIALTAEFLSSVRLRREQETFGPTSVSEEEREARKVWHELQRDDFLSEAFAVIVTEIGEDITGSLTIRQILSLNLSHGALESLIDIRAVRKKSKNRTIHYRLTAAAILAQKRSPRS